MEIMVGVSVIIIKVGVALANRCPKVCPHTSSMLRQPLPTVTLGEDIAAGPSEGFRLRETSADGKFGDISKKQSKPEGSELNLRASWLFGICIRADITTGGRVGEGMDQVL